MTREDWLVGVLCTIVVLVATALLLKMTFGFGDRRRDREELRRSAKRAAPDNLP